MKCRLHMQVRRAVKKQNMEAPCCSETSVLSSTQEHDSDLGISLADELKKVRYL